MEIEIVGFAQTIQVYRCSCGKVRCPDRAENGDLVMHCENPACKSYNRQIAVMVNKEIQVLHYCVQLFHYGVENLGGGDSE